MLDTGLNIGFMKNMDLAKAVGYDDADWAGEIDTRKSTSGLMILVNFSLVRWMSRKQIVVELSSCKV